MPVARYFFCVGGVLLALLFVFDATQPRLPVTERSHTASIDMPVVRIQSDRKWPEKVVFDTSIPTIVPAPVVQTAAVAAPAMEMSAKTRVRESFAQFVESEVKKAEPEARKPEPQVQKRKVAKNRANPPMMLVAQQPHGFFVNNTW